MQRYDDMNIYLDTTLEHAGVKGMKWGVRKARKKSGGLGRKIARGAAAVAGTAAVAGGAYAAYRMRGKGASNLLDSGYKQLGYRPRKALNYGARAHIRNGIDSATSRARSMYGSASSKVRSAYNNANVADRLRNASSKAKGAYNTAANKARSAYDSANVADRLRNAKNSVSKYVNKARKKSASAGGLVVSNRRR